MEQVLKTQPALIGHVERGTATLTIISGELPAHEARIVVRDAGRTEGYVTITAPGADSGQHRTAHVLGAEDIVTAALAQTTPAEPRAWELASHNGQPMELPSATVVLCTVGTNPLLLDAVNAVLNQTHADFELIVVDNAPHTGAVREALHAVDDPRLRIVEQPLAGLSHARNAGVGAARGEIIAFTDDDAYVDPAWLTSLLTVFAADPRHDVGAVTGPAFPAELTHPSQRYFEARGGFPRELTPTVWSLRGTATHLGTPGEGGPLYPLTTARVGAGVSMAFRHAVLTAIGPFDVALGAGTPTKGGEDLDAFARVLRAGLAIITTPDALVHHVHRRELAGLKSQTYGDGAGMAALLTKTVFKHPGSLITLARRVPAIARRVAPGSERVQGSEPGVPSGLTRLEALGFIRGPFLYAWSVLRSRRATRSGA